MKFDLMKNMKNYKGLHSAVYASYFVVLSPIITILLGLLSYGFIGDYMPLGSLPRQVYLFAFIFPILFLSVDLYQIIIKNREFNPLKSTIKSHPELFILLAFLVWNLIATLLQKAIFGSSLAYTTRIQPVGVQEGLFAFFIYGLCVFIAFMVKERQIVTNILFCFIGVATILSVLAILDPHLTFIIHQARTSTWVSLFVNSNHFSYYLTLATTLTGMGVVLSKVRWKWVLSIVLLSFFCVIMMLADTFGSNLAVWGIFLLIPFILWWFKKKFDWKYLLPLGIFSVVSFIVLLFSKSLNSNYTSFYGQVVNLIKEFFVVASAPTSAEAASAGTNRWSLWLEAFAEIKDSPIIGTGNVLLRPHNEYLQFAQVWGIPSLIIYLSAFVLIMVKAIKNRANLSDLSLTLLFSVLAFMVSAIFGNTMPHTTPFFAIFVGFLIRELNNKKIDAGV